MIYRNSPDPVFIKKIQLKIWALRDEIEAVMKHISNQPKPDEILLPETRKEKIDGEFILEEGVK